jgi:hypothetical protein
MVYVLLYTVTWRLKAGVVEPEETFIATQRLGEKFPRQWILKQQ